MKTTTVISTAACLVGLSVGALGWWIYEESFTTFHEEEKPLESRAALSAEALYPVYINNTAAAPKVLADVETFNGEPAMVSCSVCHTTREPETSTRKAEDLDEFHQGLVYAHGELSCLSCHNKDNYDTLSLADGTALLYEESIQLCAQCHGPQYRDYQNGSHGGMNGYWDLSRGPRYRNTCTTCHDAHAPAYPQMNPVFPPKELKQKHSSKH